MASKDSLIKLRTLDIPNKYIVKDLIIAVVFDDIVSFFSYRSLLEKKLSLFEEEKFINFPQIKSYEVSKKLEEKNKVFKIINDKIISPKDIDFSINLIFLKKTIIQKLIELNETDNLQKELDKANKKNKKENIFILKNVCKRNKEFPLEIQLKLKEECELDPKDINNFCDFLSIEREDYTTTFIKGYNLPRLSKKEFLEKLFNQEGSRTLHLGTLCYTIKDFKGTDNINDYVELVSNVIYSEKGEVKEKHFEYFRNSTICQPKNFQKKDLIGGYLKDGIFQLANSYILSENLNKEREYFKSKLSNFDGNFWFKKKIEAMKRYYKYPRSSMVVINFRKPLTSNIFGLPDELNNISYISGFVNTISGSRSLINTFSVELMQEFYNFVKNNYVAKGLISPNNRAYGKFNSLFSKSKFVKRSSNIPTKKELINLLELITGEVDYEDSVVSFFQNPNLTLYKGLYSISFFILCKLRDNCDLVSFNSATPNLKTFRFLKDKIYYDSENNQFVKYL